MFAILIHGRQGRSHIHPTIYTDRDRAHAESLRLEQEELYHAGMSGDTGWGIYAEVTEVNTETNR